MTEEKNNKTEQKQQKPEPNKQEINRGQASDKLYSDKPINEGYQPTDQLDTSNPPVDNIDDNTK